MRILSLATALAMVVVAPAMATQVQFQYTNGSVVADGTLDVDGGQAVSGGGTISGGGFVGTLPMTYIYPGAAPVPLETSLTTGCAPGALGCYNVQTFSCGCAFVDEDTVFNIGDAIPLDVSGIAFQVGGSALNYGFALYDAGDGTVGEIIAGDQSPQPPILNAGTAGGRLEYSVVPEPTSWALLTIGLIGLCIVKCRPGVQTATDHDRIGFGGSAPPWARSRPRSGAR